jgi:hypothetical protein
VVTGIQSWNIRLDRPPLRPSLGLYKPVSFGQGFNPSPFTPVVRDLFQRRNAVAVTDLKQLFDRLPESVRPRIQGYFKNLSQEDIYRYSDSGKLGVVEESADLLFELLKLKALRQGLITEERLSRLATTMAQSVRAGKPFGDMLAAIRQAFTPTAWDDFQKLAGVSPRHADLLPVLLTNALWCSKNSQYVDIAANVQAETREYLKEIPGNPFAKAFLTGYVALLKAFPHLSIGPLESVLLSLTRRALALPRLQRGDLLEYVLQKQMARQEVNYLHPEYDRQQAKELLKPFEVVLESAILKDIETRQGEIF